MENSTKKTNIPLWLQSVFYVYLAILPLAAFLSLYLNNSNWNWLLKFPLIKNDISRFFFHSFSFLSFFLSGIFGLIIVQNTPMPSSIPAGIYMLLDTPIQLVVAYLTGTDISPAEFILVDFAIEVTGVVIGTFWVIIKYKPNDDLKVFFWLCGVFGLLILLTFPGVLTIYWTVKSSIKDQLIFLFATGSSILMYAKAFSRRIENGKQMNDTGEAQTFMSNLSAVSMICLWIVMAIAYGRLLFI